MFLETSSTTSSTASFHAKYPPNATTSAVTARATTRRQVLPVFDFPRTYGTYKAGLMSNPKTIKVPAITELGVRGIIKTATAAAVANANKIQSLVLRFAPSLSPPFDVLSIAL